MSRRREHLVLGAYISYGTGHHAASWRHPDSDVTAIRNIDHYAGLAQLAERHLFDLIFLSDAPAVFNDDRAGFSGRVTSLEPLTLLGALAMVTRNIGLVATSSTTYKEPYDVAREYASLDHISRGRAAWNMVTTSKQAAAGNYGLPGHPPHSERYRRAEEFIDVVCKLWDTWEDDAYPADKAAGRYFDPAKRHPVHHDGVHFQLQAELNVPRPLQGHPVMVQAGSSEPGRQLAARAAEVVFTAQQDLESSSAFIDDLDARCARQPRRDPRIVVMPGLTTYGGATRAQAEERVRELQSLVTPEFGLSLLSDLVGGYDLSGVDVDGPLPALPPSNMNTSRRALIDRMAREKRMTVRQIYEQMTTSRGHLTLVGSHDEIADEMERWFLAGAADGFNIMAPLMPSGLEDFSENIIPRLQSRSCFKRAYAPGTLREKLGLQRPGCQHAR